MTTENLIIMIVSATVAMLVGYLLSRARAAAAVATQQTKLEQVEGELTAANTSLQQIQQELSDVNKQTAELKTEMAVRQQQLASSREENTQLKNQFEVSQEKSAKTEERLTATLEETRQQQHVAEKQVETAQADNRALKEQVSELRERLTQTDQILTQERIQVSVLKEELAQEGKKAKSLETSNNDAREQLNDIKQKLAEQVELYAQLQERYQSLSNEHTEQKTTLQRKEEHFKEQMQQLSDNKQALTKEFENLANKIFEEKGKTFTNTSQTSIDNMLKPFREQIDGFQKRINEVHDASLKGNTSLNSEIKKVLEIGLQMSSEANNLTSALKGDSQQRGAWGEAQLRRTLEMSGLIEDAHYEVQSAFKDAEGKQKQTDYLIKLPDGKHIIIDSKVALNAYDRAVAAESPEEYQLAMSEHDKAVRKHIDDLASKDYTNLIGMRSPNFVLMFMPIEPAYIEALKSNKELFEYGYKKGIVLVSHTTLIPILRTVSNLWMIERSNVEAREISERAGDIYNQVCTVAERLSKLGGTLSTVSKHYNSTVTALAGQQGLYGKVDRFGQLSAKVSKSLPQLEPSHMDFETERLSLIVEPINEEAQEAPALENNQTPDDLPATSSSESITETVVSENH